MAESEDTRSAIGIDLGTTNCRVGIWLDVENRFEFISNDHGNQSTPSYVAFTETERLIGDSAKDQVSRNPSNTVFDAKRLIGRKFSDLGTNADKLHIQWPFRVASGPDDKPMIHVEYRGKEKVFSVEEVYSMVLGKMKDLAEVYLGSVVNGASVSVPHCFNSAQRQATRNACSMAGFETVTLVNEPICAALAYTLDNNLPSLGEKKIMIFDLGGGSLDVTLFSVEEGVIEVKATTGDSQLGGEDFDMRLLHHFIQEIKQKYESDISSRPRLVRRLKKEVERVKLALSSDMETTIQIHSLLEESDFHSSISRSCFEEMNIDLFEKCIKCVEDCLQLAEMDKADVHEVVLIGGSSRIPKVQDLLAEFFNNDTIFNKSINPDGAVVLGAAARSGISCGYKTFSDYLVVDVTPSSLGLETAKGVMHVMHPRNSSIPKSSEQLFTTFHDDQPGIFVQVYEGENPQTCDNILIAAFELSGIPLARRGVPQILVRFDVDAYGILAVSAKDKTTGQKVDIYMEDFDIANSRVSHDNDRCQRLPIQVYNPSSPSENPNESSISSGPHESSSVVERRSEKPQADESDIVLESSQQFTEKPKADESDIILESTQEFAESSQADEPDIILESTQEFAESSQADESDIILESTQEFAESSQADEPDIILESTQEFAESSQADEPDIILESTQEFAESSQADEPDIILESTQEFAESSQADEPDIILESTHEFSDPSPADETGIILESTHEFSEPSPADETDIILESTHEFSEPSPADESDITAESTREFSEPLQADDSSNLVENRLQEFSEPAQESESSRNIEDGKSHEVSEAPHENGSSDVEETSSMEFTEPPEVFESCIAMESSPEEFCEPPQSYGEGNAEERRLQEFPEPPQASDSSNTVESRSREFSELPQACDSRNAVESMSKEFSELPQAATELSDAEESRSQASFVQKIIELVNLITLIKDFKTHKKECSTLTRRLKALLPLFEEFGDHGLPLTEDVFTCFKALEVSFNAAKVLLLLCHKGSKLYLILEQQKLANRFWLLNTTFLQALDRLPVPLGIAEEVQEQVDLVHNQFQKSKPLEDLVDAQLNAELTSVLNETDGRSKDQLERLAELFKFDTVGALMKEIHALHEMKMEQELAVDALVNERGFEQIFELLNDLQILFPQEDSKQDDREVQSFQVEQRAVVKDTNTQPASDSRSDQGAPSTPDDSTSPISLDLMRDPVIVATGLGMEGKPHESSAPPQAYGSTNTCEPPHACGSSNTVLNMSHEFAEPPHSYESSIGSGRGSQEFSGPQAHGSSNSVERRSQEFSERPPAYKSSTSLEGRSYDNSEPPQPYRSMKTFGVRTTEFSDPLPTHNRSTSTQVSRAQGFSDPTPIAQAYKSSDGSQGSSQEFSERPPFKSSHSIEGRPYEYSEPPQQYRTSKTFGSMPHESPVTTHKLTNSYPESWRKESSELAPGDEPGTSSHSEPPQAQMTSNTPERRLHENSELLPAHQRASSASGSRRHESPELSPAFKSSNASESRRHESSGRSASFTSEESSDEYSGPLRVHESEHNSGGIEHKAPGSPILHRSATTADGPSHQAQRPQNARSASCSQVRTSDSLIEDVVKQYYWEDVMDMTSNLTSRQLGKGGFGAVYLGKLENGREVAVKVLDASSQQGINEFLNEVNLLKRVNHVNLVRLLGYCQDERQVLIYEFAEEGSIWDHLQVGGSRLDWKQRLNIALQSACGLEYLHTGCSPRIIHRDIKSQNILLTKSMVAKVADFGLSKLGVDQDNICKTHVTTMVKGTLGYLDPEYLKTGQLTEKSDVYSFGVVLLEIITGRKPIQNSDKVHCFIGDWVETQYGSGSGSSSRALKAVADPSLGGHYNPKALKLVINIAKYCTQPNGVNRPEMTEVVRVLRKAQYIELDEKKSSKSWLPFL